MLLVITFSSIVVKLIVAVVITILVIALISRTTWTSDVKNAIYGGLAIILIVLLLYWMGLFT